jgi:hypothetical protein
VKGLDPIGWFLATLHQTIGHTATARYLGQPLVTSEFTPADCVLCKFNKGTATKQDVIDRIGVEPPEPIAAN